MPNNGVIHAYPGTSQNHNNVNLYRQSSNQGDYYTVHFQNNPSTKPSNFDLYNDLPTYAEATKQTI